MICRNCLSRGASAFRQANFRVISRPFSTTIAARDAAAAMATSQLSTPLTPAPGTTPVAEVEKPILPVSSVPAGKLLKGLNYTKGHEDPVALKEEEYPEWLWKCLDSTKKSADSEEAADQFSKSKKQRRLAAKRQRKYEEELLASGNLEALLPKVPLQEQTIDLPGNKEGSVEGAAEALHTRADLTKAMRAQRRSKIKEANFLKGVK